MIVEALLNDLLTTLGQTIGIVIIVTITVLAIITIIASSYIGYSIHLDRDFSIMLAGAGVIVTVTASGLLGLVGIAMTIVGAISLAQAQNYLQQP